MTGFITQAISSVAILTTVCGGSWLALNEENSNISMIGKKLPLEPHIEEVATKATIPVAGVDWDTFIDLSLEAYNGDSDSLTELLSIQFHTKQALPEWFDGVELALELELTNSNEFVTLFLESRGVNQTYTHLRSTPFPSDHEIIHLAKFYLHDKDMISKQDAQENGIPLDKRAAKSLINGVCQFGNEYPICSKTL